MPNRTVKQIRHTVSRLVQDIWTGTLSTTEAAGETVMSAGRGEADNFFKNARFRIGEDTEAEEHTVTSNTQSSGIVTLVDGLVTSKVADTPYELHRRFSAEEWNNFIELALLDAAQEGVLSSLDYQGITLAANTYEYNLPTNFVYINEMWEKDSAGEWTIRIDLKSIAIVPGGLKMLRFPRWYSMTAGRDIRVLGQGIEDMPNNPDTGIVRIDPAFVIAHARLSALSLQAERGGAVGDAATRQLRDLRTDVELKRDSMSREHRPKPGALVV